MQPKRLSVLGVGLLGGSLGLALKQKVKDCHIVGYGHRASTLQTALRMGAIDKGYADPAEAVQGAELVVLCVPVGVLGELLQRISPVLAPGAVVTDVGSTKRSIVALAAGRVGDSAPTPRFVGSHPMAGSEKRGVEHAQADLFEGALCITTPDEGTDAQALEQVEAFWRLLGMRIRRMSPEDHDRLICDVSHLPHAVAAALVNMQDEEALALAGKGFMDSTRVAAGDGGLWRDILLDNRDNLSASLHRLRQDLDHLLSLLYGSDEDALRAWLDDASKRRGALRAGQREGGNTTKA